MTAKVTETANIAAEPDLKARIMAGEVFVARRGLQQAGLFDEIIADSVESVRALVVGPDELRDADHDLRTLRNLNTPEDYRTALEEWQSGASS